MVCLDVPPAYSIQSLMHSLVCVNTMPVCQRHGQRSRAGLNMAPMSHVIVTANQQLGPRWPNSSKYTALSTPTCRPHIKAVFRPTYMFFCDQNAFELMASFCWMVSNNYSETVK